MTQPNIFFAKKRERESHKEREKKRFKGGFNEQWPRGNEHKTGD